MRIKILFIAIVTACSSDSSPPHNYAIDYARLRSGGNAICISMGEGYGFSPDEAICNGSVDKEPALFRCRAGHGFDPRCELNYQSAAPSPKSPSPKSPPPLPLPQSTRSTSATH